MVCVRISLCVAAIRPMYFRVRAIGFGERMHLSCAHAGHPTYAFPNARPCSYDNIVGKPITLREDDAMREAVAAAKSSRGIFSGGNDDERRRETFMCAGE